MARRKKNLNRYLNEVKNDGTTYCTRINIAIIDTGALIGFIFISIKRVGFSCTYIDICPLHPFWLVKDVWKRVVNSKNQLFYISLNEMALLHLLQSEEEEEVLTNSKQWVKIFFEVLNTRIP